MTPAKPVTDTPSPLDVALSYIDAGLHCHPVWPPVAGDKDSGKRPRGNGWQARGATREDFLGRYEDGDNIGVVTGKASGIVCVDVDVNRGGMRWFVENEMSLGNFVREDSGSGGIHLYYRYPDGVEFVPSWPSDAGELFPGVEVLADGGHQVVTWPSVHYTGGVYEIRNGLTLEDVRHEADPPPAWLMEYILREKTKRLKRSSGDQASPEDLDSPVDVRRVVEFLAERYPPAVEGQGGDRTTYRAACLCRDYGLSARATLKVMWEVYNPRCVPRWDRKGIAQKVKNAYDYAKDPAGSQSVAADFPEPREVIEALAEQAASSAAAAKLTSETQEEDDDVDDGASGGYRPRLPVPSAAHFLKRHEGRVLGTLDRLHNTIQLYLYLDRLGHWELADTDGMTRVIFEDIQADSRKATRGMKPEQLKNINHFIKMTAPLRRNLRPDTWLSGREGDAVACRNGIVDIRTGTVHGHTPDWFSFTSLPFDYRPGEGCPEFLRFLDLIWDGDQELKRALQLWVGYILTSRMTAQKFALFKGESRGGKGTLCRVIEALVGEDNAAACTLTDFGDKHGLELLIGKRLAVFSDAEDRVSGAEALTAADRIISVVGNDPMPVNRKNRDMMSMVFPTKVILTCNNIPPLGNRKNALTNRMIIFPFWKSFAGREDEGLLGRIKAELPGILNWALDGARAVMAGERLFQARAAGPMADEVAELLDPVQGFIADAVVFATDAVPGQPFTRSKDLYDVYKVWCREYGQGALGFRRFVQEFRSKAGDRVHADRAPDASRKKGYFGVAFDRDCLSELGVFGMVDGSTTVARLEPQAADDSGDEEVPF